MIIQKTVIAKAHLLQVERFQSNLTVVLDGRTEGALIQINYVICFHLIFSSNSGNTRRIFKFVDRIATSNIFQYATEISYVQKAMENMNTNITLGIDVKGLVSRVTINIPPPPSDRIWLA